MEELKTISETYKEQNQLLHQQRDDYGKRGRRHLRNIKKLMAQHRCQTVLDYGCGKATLSKHLPCQNYDPCIPEYDIIPTPADIVVCTDVLEHIEPGLLENVLKHLKHLTQKVGYFVIATRPDRSKTLPDGTNPHKIIEDRQWWARRLRNYFTILKMKGSSGESTFIVIPK